MMSWATAAHEARHAVAACACGLRVTRVEIFEEPTKRRVNGKTLYEAHPDTVQVERGEVDALSLNPMRYSQYECAIHNEIILCLAGPLDMRDTGFASDLSHATRIWNSWRAAHGDEGVWMGPLREKLTDFRLNATLLLSEYQRELGELTDALYERHVLEEADIAAILPTCAAVASRAPASASGIPSHQCRPGCSFCRHYYGR